MSKVTYITFTNKGSKPVIASLWWGKICKAKKTVRAGGKTNFGYSTTSWRKAWDGWTVEIKDTEKYVLTSCYSLCHNAKVTLTQHTQHGFLSSYAFKIT